MLLEIGHVLWFVVALVAFQIGGQPLLGRGGINRRIFTLDNENQNCHITFETSDFFLGVQFIDIVSSGNPLELFPL